jgi:hypothetical protein
MKQLQIVAGNDFAAAFDRWRANAEFAGVDDDPVYGAFGHAYYPTVFEERRRKASFAVTEGDKPLAIVQCTSGDDEFDYFGAPVRVVFRDGLSKDKIDRVASAAFVRIDALAGFGRHRRVAVRDDSNLNNLSPLGKQCLNRRAAAALRLTGLCRLDQGEVGIRRSLRKSFRSLVNWGQRNLRLVSIDAKNPDCALFKAYQDFHTVVARRITRPQASWRAMFNWIAQGGGELILGYLGDELVAGTMVVDSAVHSYYASGVYDRNRFNQPLAHWPLFNVMLHSMSRGKQMFVLGDLPLPGAASDKEIAIGYFKRGFATDIQTWICWTWDAAETKTREEVSASVEA